MIEEIAIVRDLIAERDQLRAEVERLQTELDFEKAENDFGCGGVRSSLRGMTARAEAAEAHFAVLRGAMAVYFANYMLDEAESADECVCGEEQHRHAVAVRYALAITPAQALGQLKAEALREMADRLDKQCCECHDECIQDLIDEADRLEKGAANGK